MKRHILSVQSEIYSNVSMMQTYKFAFNISLIFCKEPTHLGYLIR